MDDHRFDALTRAVSSRRTALGRLLGGSLTALLGLPAPEEAAAHSFMARCRAIRDPQRRAACLRRAKAHRTWHVQHPPCVPQALALTCVGRCGVYTNNCNQATACPCPAGKTCLGNGSCAQTCSSETCPSGCLCGSASAEGSRQCIKAEQFCADLTQCCTSSAGCPLGWQCQFTGCSGSACSRCVQLCPS